MSSNRNNNNAHIIHSTSTLSDKLGNTVSSTVATVNNTHTLAYTTTNQIHTAAIWPLSTATQDHGIDVTSLVPGAGYGLFLCSRKIWRVERSVSDFIQTCKCMPVQHELHYGRRREVHYNMWQP